MKRWMRRLARLLLGLLLLVAGLGAGLAFLVHSPQGTRWLWQLAADLAPGRLAADELTGRLSGPLELRGLVYRDGELELRVGRLYLDWEPLALVRGRVHLVALEVDSPHLVLPPSDGAPEPPPEPGGPFPGLALPLDIDLDRIRVTDARITPAPGEPPLVVDHLLLGARARTSDVTLTTLEAAAFAADLRASGEMRLVPGLPLTLALNWGYRLPDGPRLAGGGRVTGDLNRLHLVQTLEPPLAARLEATALALETHPRWDASLALQDLALGALVPAFPAHVKGRLTTSGDTSDMGLDGTLSVAEPTLGDLSAGLAVRFDGSRLALRTLEAKTGAGTTLSATGHYVLAGGAGSLALDLDWRALRWPLAGEAVQVRSGQGRLHLDGSPEDYGYRLESDLTATGQPTLALRAEGRGGLESIRFTPLEARLPEGRLVARGEAAWTPQVRWQVALEGEGLDPALFEPGFPGKLALALESRGRLQAEGPELDVRLNRLQGVLRDYPVNAGARVRLAAGELAIESLALASGSARVEAAGRLGKQWDLGWSLQAPALENLWPGLAGAVQGKGRLVGDAGHPRVRADLTGAGIRYQDQGIEGLTLAADLGLDDRPLHLALKAEGLAAAGRQWRTLTLTGAGTRAEHTLELALAGEQVPELQLALAAGLTPRDSWVGHLDSLVLSDPVAGTWRLRDPANFDLAAQAQRLESLCLEGPPGGLCSSFRGSAEQGWHAELAAPRLALDALGPLLPEGLQLQGHGQLQVDFAAAAGDRIRGTLNLELPEARLLLEVAGSPRTLEFSATRVTAELGETGGSARLRLPLADLGGVEGELSLPGLALPQLDVQQQALEGRVQAEVSDLGWVSGLVPQLANVRGRVAADLALSGRLAAPRLQGRAQLAEAALDIPELGLELRELALALTAPTLERVAFEGGVSSGGGRLALSGDTRLEPEQGFPTRVHLEGSDWVAVDVPEAEMQVSPKLELAYSAEESRLEGEIGIPFARIRPRELPESAVSSSADLVVVSGDQPPPPENVPRFSAKLRILFGDRVSFEGFGLRGRLTGDLQVVDEPGRPVIGSGRVGIADGTYRAYGQDLKIQRGYALFADSPVDNPGLDVKAVREAGEVTAGLRVTGTLKKPRLDLFSTPAMTQSEVLSYLLTGHGPEGGGQSAGLTAALAASGAGSAASEISRQLGLDELRVETGSDLSQASMVAGTWLSPRLYVQYVNDLAARDSKLRFRYDLTNSVQIQTETGSSQGVDLYYTIEH